MRVAVSAAAGFERHSDVSFVGPAELVWLCR